MTQQKIWSVSQLNSTVRELVEDGFFPLWLKGEVGNITIHRSGHVYFTLKDKTSQISAVYFKGANEAKRLNLQEGQEIEIFGKVSVYEPRGSYQLNISQIRLLGIGDLQKKFEQLKQKLYEEGLFSEDRKKTLPQFPQKIGIITSPQGAAIQDFINIIKRRFDSLQIVIYPAPVQGKGAAQKLAQGINWFNQQDDFDAIILTRGGGSLEDLWEFNEEVLARTIADSNIPIISAVGHEVDFTISDFVADLRVPTPSSAAEIIIGKKSDFITTVNNFQHRLQKNLENCFFKKKMQLEIYQNNLLLHSPLRKLQSQQQLLDESHSKITYLLSYSLSANQQKILHLKNRFYNSSPQPIWQAKNSQLQELRHQFENIKKTFLQNQNQNILLLKQKLELLNPKNILKRGYAIIQDNSGNIIYKSNDIKIGEKLEVTLAHGTMTVRKDQNGTI